MAQAARKIAAPLSIARRIDALDWSSAEQSLSERGYAVTDSILSDAECNSLVALFNDSSHFRTHVIMEGYRFGIGDYKYFAHPLPEVVTELRSRTYPHLAEVANHWRRCLVKMLRDIPANMPLSLKSVTRPGSRSQPR
jgi:hypothetical protein